MTDCLMAIPAHSQQVSFPLPGVWIVHPDHQAILRILVQVIHVMNDDTSAVSMLISANLTFVVIHREDFPPDLSPCIAVIKTVGAHATTFP